MRDRIFAVVLTLFVCSAVFAQEHQHGDHHATDEFGSVDFAINCSPKTQVDFNRSVALLHDFWYAEAEKAFTAVATADTECAMAYWGIAMSNYHPIWAPPNPAEMEKGKAAALKAAGMTAKSEREKDYIAAINVFYKDSDKLDHLTRANNYAQTMEKLHHKYPDDLEGSVFYALALLGTAQASDKTYAVQKKAAGILTPLVEKAPNHPGIAHYIIHSFDYPSLAELALPAARTYAKIAPSSPHALHMPSHIFIRLGLWDEAISSNLQSAETARKHVEKTNPGAGSFDQLHAMDYLVYAYLQLDQPKKAEALLEQAKAMQKVDLANVASAYSFAAMPARYAVERHQWKEAAALQLKPEWLPWEKFPYSEAIIHYAVGLGAARSGDVPKAKTAADRLGVLKQTQEATDKYWAGQIEIQGQSVLAWIAMAEGKKDEAVRMMKAVVALEDATEKHPVTPGVIMPAHELLGEMLVETGQFAEARAEFEKSLTTAPNRRNPKTHLSSTALAGK